MLEALRTHVLWANKELAKRGLARFTFGNASAIDRGRRLVIIKPSGVAYDVLTADDLVVTELNGRVVSGELRPSSDLPTHLDLYRAFPNIGGIVHTHSHFATVWAQAGKEIPCLGTTHADYFRGPIPITAPLGPDEIAGDYEAATGRAIARQLFGINPLHMPAVLVHGHASFCWGATVRDAVETASVLEAVAAMAYRTTCLNPGIAPISDALRERHFQRKHGPAAYYGQAEPVAQER
ncbi:MAG: L-ribulose-5-phosphate 4-epimerase AraD [Gemmatimonadaceae bacterium]